MANGDNNGNTALDRAEQQHIDLTQQNIRDIGMLRSDFSGLQSAVNTGFEQLTQRLEAMSQPKPQGQGLTIAALTVSLVVCLGLIVNFAMATLKDRTDQKLNGVSTILEIRANTATQLIARVAEIEKRELEMAYTMGLREQQIIDTADRLGHLDELMHIRNDAVNQWILKAAELISGNTATVTAINHHLEFAIHPEKDK